MRESLCTLSGVRHFKKPYLWVKNKNSQHIGNDRSQNFQKFFLVGEISTLKLLLQDITEKIPIFFFMLNK